MIVVVTNTYERKLTSNFLKYNLYLNTSNLHYLECNNIYGGQHIIKSNGIYLHVANLKQIENVKHFYITSLQ